jgi:hypothetical protein
MGHGKLRMVTRTLIIRSDAYLCFETSAKAGLKRYEL